MASIANGMATAIAICHQRYGKLPRWQNGPNPTQDKQESYVHRWLPVVQDFDLETSLANAREK